MYRHLTHMEQKVLSLQAGLSIFTGTNVDFAYVSIILPPPSLIFRVLLNLQGFYWNVCATLLWAESLTIPVLK